MRSSAAPVSKSQNNFLRRYVGVSIDVGLLTRDGGILTVLAVAIGTRRRTGRRDGDIVASLGMDVVLREYIWCQAMTDGLGCPVNRCTWSYKDGTEQLVMERVMWALPGIFLRENRAPFP